MVVKIRDYAAEMRELFEKFRGGSGSYNAVTASHEIEEYLLREDRELYFGWLEAHGVSTIRAALVAVDAATRQHARVTTASVFAAAAAQAEAGDSSALRQGFLQAIYTIDTDNNRKALKDMTAADVLFVAESYEDRAKASLFEAAFFKAIAKKIGKGRVADVYNNVQLSELRLRMTGKE